MAIFSAKYCRNLGIFLQTFIRITVSDQNVNLSLTENDGFLTCSISNDSTGTALAWDTEDITLSYPSHKNYFNITQNTKIEVPNTLRQYMSPILDYRWEFLPLAACFYRIPKQSKFRISISIQEGNFVHMCKDNNTCKKFSLEGNSIRGPYEDNGDKNRCNIEIENRNQKWQHFTIRRKNIQYIIKLYNSTSQLTLCDFEANYIIISGKWKVHDFYVYSIKSNDTLQLEIKNNFLNYDNACYGLLVKTSNNSSLTLELQTHSYTYLNETSKMVQEWQEINLCAFTARKTVTLLIKPNISSRKLVQIADVIRHYNTDVRNSTLKKTNSSQCCYDLKFSNKICSASLINYDAVGTKQLIVYSISNNSAKLRFQPDSKITPLEHYKVGWIEDNKASGSESCNQTFPCEIWTGQICVECNNLPWNSLCRFWVYYKGNTTTEFRQAIATTGEKGPSTPEIIEYFWNDTTSALTLTLIHPDIPNGRITHFDFYISGNKIDTYCVVKENLTYTHAIEFPEVNFSSDLNISVSAHNKHGENSINKIISTPPKTPKFLEDPIFVDMPCIIQISQVLDKDDTLSNMYVMLTRGNELKQPRPLTEFEEKIFRCGNIQDRGNSRIIQNISINALANSYSGTIDACSNLADGDELQSGSNLFILLENTYNGNSRCKTYSIASEMNYNSLFSILIVPIIGLIIFFVYKQKKSKFDAGHTYAYATNLSNQSEVTNDVAIYEEVDEAKADNNEDQKNRPLPVCPTNEVVIYEEIDKATTDNNEDQKNKTLSVFPIYDEVRVFGEPAEIIDGESIIWDTYLSFTNSVSECVSIQELEDYMDIYMKTQEFQSQYKLFNEPWYSRLKQENKRKNRDKNLATYSSARITLTPYLLSDKTSTYINAIRVDGFRAPSRFIVTQYPSSETVGSMWRLIDEYEIPLMICLNKWDFVDETCCKFYPEEKESMQPVPFLEIESVKVIHGTHYTSSTLSINNSKKKNQRTMKVLHLNEWEYNMLHPETPTTLLMTYEEMNCLENNKVLIACLDAKTASGLFTAMCCLIDQIKMENICDVSSAVRKVRRSRAEFVPELEQFVFLYNCALAYVKQNEKYSNIRINKINF